MRPFFKSFAYAFRGIMLSFRKQRNIKVQLTIGVLAIVWSVLIGLPALEFGLVLLICFMVIMLEMLNTAMEKMIDLISPGYHRRFGEIKDIFAGVVFLAAILSVLLGLLILWKPSLDFLTKALAR